MTEKLSGPMIAPKDGDVQQIVILLHGYGADGNDLIGLASYWQPLLPQALFLSPHAPDPCEMSPLGRQWFPLDLTDPSKRYVGAEAAAPSIRQLLADVWGQTGLGPEQTVLVGFSQGAMMTLHVGLRLEKPLAGLIGFSGLLIAPEKAEAEIRAKAPVCLCHGERDEVVPVEGSIGAAAALKDLGLDVELHLSPGAGHTITEEGLGAAGTFLSWVLASAES